MIFAHFSLCSSMVLCYKIINFYQKNSTIITNENVNMWHVINESPFSMVQLFVSILTKDKPICKFQVAPYVLCGIDYISTT